MADLEAEIATAEVAERKAKWEAGEELVRSHREHDKAAVDERLDRLKASSAAARRPRRKGRGRGGAIPF